MKGRLLGVDFGVKRVGLAVCDVDRIIASPFATYERKDAERDAAFYCDLIRREQIVEIIVGLPVHTDGAEGVKAAEARAYGRWLQSVTDVAARYWDERFSTVQAESALWNAGLTHKRRKERRDRVAAQILLQSFIDAGCPPHEGTGRLQ